MAELFLDIANRSEQRDSEFADIEKFNPYHGADGRFTSGSGATSFTYKPGASKAHDSAIAREKAKSKSAGNANIERKHDSKEELKELGEHLPGIKRNPVVYADNDVAIRRGESSVQVYHNTGFKSPLKGLPKKGWLSTGSWAISDGKYHELNGIGRRTGRTAKNYDEIAGFVRGNS